jgi:hypothetical protein
LRFVFGERHVNRNRSIGVSQIHRLQMKLGPMASGIRKSQRTFLIWLYYRVPDCNAVAAHRVS